MSSYYFVIIKFIFVRELDLHKNYKERQKIQYTIYLYKIKYIHFFTMYQEII